MAKQLTKTVYTFTELLELEKAKTATKAAVEKARTWLRQAATDNSYWYDSTKEWWEQALTQIGFDNAKIVFSGFWNQGDGASFLADVDLEKLINFLSADIQPAETVTLEDGEEDFRAYLVHKCNGVRSNRKFDWLLVIRDYIEDVQVERTESHYCHENTCLFRATLNDKGKWVGNHSDGHWKSNTPNVCKLFDDFVDAAEQLRLDLSLAIYKDLEEEYNYLTSDEAIAEDAEANEYTFTLSGQREG